MAKNPFWLRGARGKFAGSVVQKGENGTVIRENVKPSNPQTNAQMIVRTVFGTLNTAAYWLQKIVGQTFEKTENATKNKRAFVSRNFPYLRSVALLDAQGRADLQGAFDPKGSRILTPNNYLVSHGSIATPDCLRFKYEDEDLVTTSNTIQIPAGTYSAAQLWEMLTGLRPGQQLTFIGIETKNGEDVAYESNVFHEYGAGIEILRYAEFTSARLVLLESEGDNITISSETTRAQVITCMDSLVDNEKTSGLMWNATSDAGLASCISKGQNGFIFAADHMLGEITTSEWTIQSAGFIISEQINGSWHYNSCRLASFPPEYYDAEPYGDRVYGLTILCAIESYKSSSSNDSELYTRQGGDNNSINF